MNDSLFCLRWNNFQRNIISAFGNLWADEDFVDVTLSCGNNSLQAHKIVLSACSLYFKDLLKKNPCQHPIIILQNVAFDQLQKLVEFMYNGQVNVSQENLRDFLKTAEVLKIKGLAEENKDCQTPCPDANLSPYCFGDSTEDSLIKKVVFPTKDDSLCISSSGSSKDVNDAGSVSPDISSPLHNVDTSNTTRTEYAPLIVTNASTKLEPNEYYDSDVSYNYAETKLEVDEDSVLTIPSDASKHTPNEMEVDNNYVLSGISGERIQSRKLAENSVQCLYCPKLVTRQHMKRHVRDIHSPNLQRVTCHICGKKYKNANSLTAHHYYAHRKQPDKDASLPVISQVYESTDFDIPLESNVS